eukprot:PITA_30027
MRVAEHFSKFVHQEDTGDLLKEVTMEELEATLKWFKKDKSPSPDGWTIEFYIAFFEILGEDLLKIVENCRRSGRISSAIKSTFIALISKPNNPSSYNDFCPISLCNCLYKIISKIIANHLKPTLSRHISSEQFAFLHHRQIHEAIATAQELLHTLQIKKQKGMILKVDLSKAFDRCVTQWGSYIFLQFRERTQAGMSTLTLTFFTHHGRIKLILIKAVIEATPVYWMTLAWILKGILNILQSICCRFLWKGNQLGKLFAWVKWDTIAKPKSWGGWGIKRLDLFSKALAAKLGWQLITSNSLWSRVVQLKYI